MDRVYLNYTVQANYELQNHCCNTKNSPHYKDAPAWDTSNSFCPKTEQTAYIMRFYVLAHKLNGKSNFQLNVNLGDI